MKIITPEQAIELDRFFGKLKGHYEFIRNARGNFDIYDKGSVERITSWTEKYILKDKDFVFYLEKGSNANNY